MMNRTLAGAVFVVAATATPALADYWVVQDTASKRCQIVEQKPTGPTRIIVGGENQVYRSRTEAEAALKSERPCDTSANAAADFPPAKVITTVPANASSLAHNWYKQNVYDPTDKKIGEISDAIVDKEGKIVAFVIGVGGFLGMGEKDVAVPLHSIHVTTKDNNKWYLVMNATKDDLKNASGMKYDRSTATWEVTDK
jgi:sporulation protein YlmC with PRC-barrel domain